MASEIIVISPELMRLIESVPVELLRAGPKRYAPMQENKNGSWKYIYYGNTVVATAWTDWDKSFDIINRRDCEITDRLGNYVITAKALDIPAGWAYTSLETVISKYDTAEKVTLSGQYDGKLREITEPVEETRPSGEEVENGPEQEV